MCDEQLSCQSPTDLEILEVHDALQEMQNTTEVGLEKVSHKVHSMSIANEPYKAKLQSFNVNACVESTVKKLSKQFPDTVTIVLELMQLPHLYIDVYKISQLLTNLIINAKEAIESEGKIYINTINKGNYIEITVTDMGCGIEKHLLELIFDPYFSTKQDASIKNRAKLGLGLAISKDIALERGGNLFVNSIYGEGSIFTLQLPVSKITIH